MTRKYWVLFEWSGKNFSGHAPDVPGCIATAKTREGVRNRLKTALESHLQWLQDDGDALPEASAKLTVDMENDPEFPNPRGYYVLVEALDIKLPRKRSTTSKRESSAELVAA